jgi:hypothetical protein
MIVRVVQELMDPVDFTRSQKDRAGALAKLNETLVRERIEAYLDGAGQCHVRTAAGTSAAVDVRARAFTQKDRETRAKWADYLDTGSEDDFTEKYSSRFYRAAGFSASPSQVTQQAARVRQGPLDEVSAPHFALHLLRVASEERKAGLGGQTKTGNENITEALNQIRMALQNPVLDTEVNRKVLIDHVYLIASGDIAKAARNFLVEKLDAEQRRQLIFMDRSEILDLLILTNMELPSPQSDPDVPF